MIEHDNEKAMKLKGEMNIWKDILSKSKSDKQISSSQIGQQLIVEEAIRIFDDVQSWINLSSSTKDRLVLKKYFADDELLLGKIASTLLLLSGTIYTSITIDKKVKTRHKTIKTIQRHIFEELDFDLVWKFTEILIHYSEFYVVVKSKVGDKTNVKYTSTLSDSIFEKLANKAFDAFYPLPMTIVPIDWDMHDGKIIGGYEYYQYDMVRAKRIDYNKYADNIFDVLNYIQSTPWTINKDVLKQLSSDLKSPRKSDYLKTEYPGHDTPYPNITIFKKDVSELVEGSTEFELHNSQKIIVQDKIKMFNAELKDFESDLGKYRATKMALDIAEKYKDNTIYFPHNYDFRGRIYPIPVGLNPQGSSQVKALLEYAEGETLNNEGVKWMWAYLATLFGDDKIKFSDRVKRGQELIDTPYIEADEPYEFLAQQLEIRKYLNDNTYKVKTRIHLDACNSGSQFSSAITGDINGCIATNVIPTILPNGDQERKDAYMLVANKSLDKTKEILDFSKENELDNVEMYEFFVKQLEDNGRKICKTPVMVSNYGGTTGGRTDILWNLFRTMKVDMKWINRKTAASLSKIIGDSITGVLTGGKRFEQYICAMNNIIAKDNKPVYWETADGFAVTHLKNKELPAKRVKCRIPGSRQDSSITKISYSKDNNPRKMRSAISPNYIHSLDAQLLRMVAMKMYMVGIKHSDWIHDSFGTTPNNTSAMLDITRETFRELMLNKPLELLRDQLELQVTNPKDLNKIEYPNLGTLTKEDYDSMLNSWWIFS
jgi:DNA-directed RNA polymerase